MLANSSAAPPLLKAVWTVYNCAGTKADCNGWCAMCCEQATGMTVLLVAGLTLFAFQTKFDFAGVMPYCFAALLTLLLFGTAAQRCSC